MSMRSRTRYIMMSGVIALIVLLVFVVLPGENVHPQSTKAKAAAWKALAGYDLSGVAWSPNGKHIAFVATPKVPTEVKERLGGPKRADIWLMDLPAEPLRLRRIVKLEESHGIPVALFWISDREIGWAAAYTVGWVAAYTEKAHGFRFFKADVGKGELSRLTECRFDMAQTRVYGEGVYAPDDVCWDSKARAIAFTAQVMAYTDKPDRILGLYNVDRGILSVVIPDYGFMFNSLLTFCLAPGGARDGLYVAGPRETAKSRPWQVWFTSSMVGLHEQKRIVNRERGALAFPRVSPNGKMLAVLLSLEGPHPQQDKILVHDLATGSEKTVASLSPEWDQVQPGMGCPFSWSPDGKEIAYADGSMIKIVQVPASIKP